MTNFVTKSVLLATILSLGYGVGRYFTPPKVVEKEKIVYKDRIIEREVKVKSTSKKNDKVFTKNTVTKPDGTKYVEVKITDKSKIKSDFKRTGTRQENISLDKTEESKQTNYLISLGAKFNLGEFGLPIYGVNLNKRILGPIYLGVFGFTDKTIGVSLGLGL